MVVRDAREVDVPAIVELIDGFARGHPAERLARSHDKLRAAYFGERRVASLLVAEQRSRIVGMVQWSLFYDQLWSMFGVRGEWLYVRPEARGLGTAAALVASVCAAGRRAGAEFLQGGANNEVVMRLYERFSIGERSHEWHVSAEAFQVFADLAGRPTRDIVRGLPAPALSRVPARPRT